MDHLLLLALVCLTQVCGSPMFFWSQQEPDCSQQTNDNTYQNYDQNTYQGYQAPSYQPPSYQGSNYQAPSYQGSNYQAPSYQGSNYQAPSYQGTAYQGPSYQETLQAMITDTLRALCDIVQSTMRASKQEIATLARLFLQKGSTSDCENPEEESYYEPKPTDGSSNSTDTQGGSTLGAGMSSSTKTPEVPENSNLTNGMTNTTDLHNSTVSSPLKVELNASLISNSTHSEMKPANSTTEKVN